MPLDELVPRRLYRNVYPEYRGGVTFDDAVQAERAGGWERVGFATYVLAGVAPRPAVAPPEGEFVTFERGRLFEMLGEVALPPAWDEAAGEPVGHDIDCAELRYRLEAKVNEYRIRS